MNSSPVLDAVTLVATPELTKPAPLPAGDCPKEPFGAVLEQATAEQATEKTEKTESPESPGTEVEDFEDSETPSTKPALDKKKTEEICVVLPLICFCPPPEVKPIAPPAAEVTATSTMPLALEEAPKGSTLTEKPVSAPATTAAPETTALQAAPETVVSVVETTLPQAVRPKLVANGKVVQRAAPAKSAKEAAIELPRELFEPVDAELKTAVLPKIEPLKLPQAARATVTNSSHGTLVAQLENRVKNTEKSAEFAPAIEQKMPVREVPKRGVVETARVESFQTAKTLNQALQTDFHVEAAPEVIPLKSLAAVQLAETIRTEVTSLRQRGDVAMTVALRPDNNTQLALDVSITPSGVIHAQVRCERGDFQNLNAHWPQLQQSLAAHGIQIADLSNHNHSQQHHNQSNAAFQNFDRGQNPQQQRDQREYRGFEEEIAAATPRPAASKAQQSKPASTAATARRWQSWA